MSDSNSNKPVPGNSRHRQAVTEKKSKPEQLKSNMSMSMHDGVEVWCDCCSCEAEPYWIEAMQNDEALNQDSKDHISKDSG